MSVARPERLIVLLAALVAFGPLSIDMYLPSLPQIAGDLGASEASIQLTISVFLGGISVGMLVYGPLSDRFGRRRLLLGGMVLYALASLGCALAQDAPQLIVLRGVQALGGAAAAVLGRAIVRDIFPLRDAARVLSLMHMVTMVATLVAPIIGGYLMLITGWRALFYVLMAFASLCLLLTYRLIPETHHAEHRGASVAQAFRAYALLLRAPSAVGLFCCTALTFAGMFAYITASPFIYIEYFGVSPQHYGWLFGLNIVGVILATLVNAWLVGRLGPERMLAGGSTVVALSGLALALAAGSDRGGLAAVVSCLFCYVSMTGLIGANCLACLLNAFPRQAGAAAGLTVAAQFGAGMLCSALVGALHDGTPVPMAMIMGVTGTGCALAFWLARLTLTQFQNNHK